MRPGLVSILLLPLAACAHGSDVSAPAASEAVAEARVIDLSPAEVRAKLADGNIRLIDVRRDDEVAQGMIPGAEHIPLAEFAPEELDLSDGREVILYCRSSGRSRVAAEALAAHTGEPAQHLDGGILAWQAAGGPITSD